MCIAHILENGLSVLRARGKWLENFGLLSEKRKIFHNFQYKRQEVRIQVLQVFQGLSGLRVSYLYLIN